MNIVVVQWDIVWQNRAANHERIRELLAAETIAPGSLIVLPEMFDIGFSMDLDAAAQDASRASEEFLRELASQHRSSALGGVVGPIVDGKATNEAVAFGPDGAELTRYVKRRPFTLGGEDAKYRAGCQAESFDWDGLKIAPLICYDL
ncbi:MAG: hypothetical protein KDA61_19280, partial [Planctomycetales bacterium]|nr:hypothetical protein [Planctomycetales bacterium]